MLIVEKTTSSDNDSFYQQFEQSLNNVYMAESSKMNDSYNTTYIPNTLPEQQLEQKPKYQRKTVIKYHDKITTKHIKNYKMNL